MKHFETRQLNELAKTNPLKCAEQLLARFVVEFDEAMVKLGKAVGDEAICKALLKAGECYRRLYAFGFAVYQATGRSIYRRSWNFQERLPGDYHRRLWRSVKGGSTPTVEYPAIAVEVLKKLEEAPKPEALPRPQVAEEYTSRTRPPRLPSID